MCILYRHVEPTGAQKDYMFKTLGLMACGLILACSAPQKANEVAAQIMAEMREMQHQEAKGKTKSVAEKVIESILAPNATPGQHSNPGSTQKMTASRSGFWWAARPAGCA